MRSYLNYPKKSHRKIIAIPRECKELAEFLGIEFGDGSIGNLWQVVISLNSIKDNQYASYINKLGQKLFNIEPKIRKRPNQKTIVVVFSSTSLVNFLIEKGAVKGNKIQQKINIPNWIVKNSDYQKAFVRGLIDTDGCLYIHKHVIKGITYQNIVLCFTSFSKKIILSVASILEKNDIKPYITDKDRRIYLYSEKSVVKYIDAFGSSNPRIINKYLEWRGVRVAERARLESA